MSAHLGPALSVWVTMFDRTTARELEHEVPAVHVLSPSGLVAADLAEQCIAMADRVPSGPIRLVDDALRLLMGAGAELILTLLVEAAITMIALHENVVTARSRQRPIHCCTGA